MQTTRVLLRSEWIPDNTTNNPYDLMDLGQQNQLSSLFSSMSSSWLQWRCLSWKLRYTPTDRYYAAITGTGVGDSVARRSDALLVMYTSDPAVTPASRPALVQGQQTKCFSPSDPFELSGPVWPSGLGPAEILFATTQASLTAGVQGTFLFNGFGVAGTPSTGTPYAKGSFIVESLVEFRELA